MVDVGFKLGVHDCGGGGEDGQSRNISDEDLVVVLSFVVGPAEGKRDVESC